MPRVPLSLSAGVVAYLTAMAGITFLGVQLSSVVTAKVIALSLPHFVGQSPPAISRIEQRRMSVAQAIPPMPVAKVAALQRPAVPLGVFVAQLDSAETEEVVARPALKARKRFATTLRLYSDKRVPAADAFNRSFGVIPVASN